MARRKKKSRKNSSRNSVLTVAIFLVLCAIIVMAWKRLPNDENTHSSVAHAPSSTMSGESLLRVIIPDTIPSQIVDYTGMTLSFNARRHTPNWVAWELTGDETTGTVKRSSTFYNDPNVAGCPETYDYLYSGYDRGHMAPAADMKWSADAMKETFYLTNICPQDHKLNIGSWNNLEEKCRALAQIDSAIIIISGPLYLHPTKEFLGDNRVEVPSHFFKVILSPYSEQPSAIAFLIANSSHTEGLQKSATSINNIESLTGYDFFSALPNDVEEELEAQNDFMKWNRYITSNKRKTQKRN